MARFTRCDWCNTAIFTDEMEEAEWIYNAEEEVDFCSDFCSQQWWDDSRKTLS